MTSTRGKTEPVSKTSQKTTAYTTAGTNILVNQMLLREKLPMRDHKWLSYDYELDWMQQRRLIYINKMTQDRILDNRFITVLFQWLHSKN